MDIAPDVAEVAIDVLNDGCGGDACGADDVQPDVANSDDATAVDASPDAAQDTGSTEDAQSADADALDCAAVMAKLQDAINALATGHLDCQHDADCTNVSTTTACVGTCGIGLNVAFVTQFESGLAALDAKYCAATNYAAICGYVTPKCIAPNPGCVNSQCVYKK